MLDETIKNVQDLERLVAGKTTDQLNARIAIRGCLKELRAIAARADDRPHCSAGTVLPFIFRAPSLSPAP
ncbi:MAG: hypothetical protein EKK40_02580 [Bradyrhizobiaceae bacterium]|nr:MAG: hypothetical protein EKK40_02580 [Bradyrhizobiaceae bacterium]